MRSQVDAGYGVGALLGMPLALATAWNVPFFFMIIPNCVSAGIYLTIRIPRGSRDACHNREHVLVDLSRQTAKRPSLRQVFERFWHITKRDGNFRALLLFFVLFEVIGIYLYWIYGPKFLQVGIPYQYWGFIVFGFNLLTLLMASLAAKLDSAWTPRRAVLSGVLSTGSLFFLLALTHNPLVSVILVGLLVAVDLLFYSLLLQYLNEYFTSKARVTLFSVVQLLCALVRACLGPFLGSLLDVNVDLFILLLGVIFLCALPFVVSVRTREPKSN